MAVPELRATNTHLYPGAWLAASRPLARGDDVAVRFVDGAAAVGRIVRAATDELQLDTEPYRTGRGTKIPAKAWRLQEVPAPDAGPGSAHGAAPDENTIIHYRVAGRAGARN